MPMIDLELSRILARPAQKCERPAQGHVCKKRCELLFPTFASVAPVWLGAGLV